MILSYVMVKKGSSCLGILENWSCHGVKVPFLRVCLGCIYKKELKKVSLVMLWSQKNGLAKKRVTYCACTSLDQYATRFLCAVGLIAFTY